MNVPRGSIHKKVSNLIVYYDPKKVVEASYGETLAESEGTGMSMQLIWKDETTL
jgi:hypothetical protein